MKFFILISSILILSLTSYPQVENIPSDNSVYIFLKRMQVSGIIPDYDDFVLPLSKRKIDSLLLNIKQKEAALSEVEAALLHRFLEKFAISAQPLSLFSDLENNLKSDRIKYFVLFNDSLLNFTLNPLLGFKTIVLTGEADKKNPAFLGKIGGNLYGTYDGWLGFFLEGTNEVLWGNRTAALTDPEIAQSYTFNRTEINFIDNTSGYLRFETKHVSLQLGRERVLWGSGYENRMVLSNNPPPFDFVRFNFEYKAFSYKFIHGWLVQPSTIIIVDSLNTVKTKPSKYIAISRLGFNPSDNIKLGISQFVIYSNRPFEAAYLNPLLFWESAQRSMNDLDNSFLSLDLRILIIKGLELNTSILLDDIHFGKMFNEGWNDVSNRNAWNAGIYLTNPLIFPDMSFSFDYIQVRPYMFSHPGIGEMLTYTNNSYLLGEPYQPNSSNFNLKFSYQLTPEVLFDAIYNYSLHGQNVRDSEGNLVRNVGGNIWEFFSFYDEREISLLEGILEKNYSYTFNVSVEPLPFIFVNLGYTLIKNQIEENIFQLSLNYKVL